MAKEKRTYAAESGTAKSMKLRSRPSLDKRTGLQTIDRHAKVDNQFSREMIQRLIDWFKQD